MPRRLNTIASMQPFNRRDFLPMLAAAPALVADLRRDEQLGGVEVWDPRDGYSATYMPKAECEAGMRRVMADLMRPKRPVL